MSVCVCVFVYIARGISDAELLGNIVWKRSAYECSYVLMRMPVCVCVCVCVIVARYSPTFELADLRVVVVLARAAAQVARAVVRRAGNRACTHEHATVV